MKKIVFFLCLLSSVAYGQTTYYIRADSTRLEKIGGNNELILLNSTRNLTGGVLTNIGNGRTAFTNISAGLSKFRRSLEIAEDSLQLVNDQANPSDTSYYGKLGAKGWFAGALIDVSDNAVGGLSYWLGGRLFRIGDSLSWSSSGLNNKYRYLINGNQVVWLPDQTNFSHTSIYGNGGGSLSHSSGIEGQYNTAVGWNSLTNITTGFGNVAAGSRVMQSVTSGTNNTAIGEGAMQSGSTGVHNTAVGSQALAAVSGGGYNVAVGSISQSNASGSYNVSMGYTSMNDLLNGGMNVGIGYQAIFYNRTGGRNTGIGFAALKSATATSFSNATALGDSAGAGNSANKSTYLGSRAGYNHTGGAGSLFIGNDVQSPAPNEDGVMNIKNIIYGRGATGTETTSAGNIGIGVTNPLEKLEIGGRLKINTVDDAVIDSVLGLENGRVVKQAASAFSGGGGGSSSVEINSSVTSSGSITAPTAAEKYVPVDASSGAVALTLPTTTGKVLSIKKTDASSNAVTFTTSEGSQSINTQNAGVRILYNGSAWVIVGIF